MQAFQANNQEEVQMSTKFRSIPSLNTINKLYETLVKNLLGKNGIKTDTVPKTISNAKGPLDYRNIRMST